VNPIHQWPKRMNKESLSLQHTFSFILILILFFQIMKFLLFITVLISLSMVVYSSVDQAALRIEYDIQLNAFRDIIVKVLKVIENKMSADKKVSITTALANLKSKKHEEFQQNLQAALIVLILRLEGLGSPYVDKFS
jgi:hypothetical protein